MKTADLQAHFTLHCELVDRLFSLLLKNIMECLGFLHFMKLLGKNIDFCCQFIFWGNAFLKMFGIITIKNKM